MSATLFLPLFARVDTVIVGSSTGAVAAALELRKAGRSVFVVNDRTFFGEECAGELRLWPGDLDISDPLVTELYAGEAPVFPGRMKRLLETKLMEAGVRFLFLSRPVAVLRDETGRIGGLLVAARTSLFVVRCGNVIDASRYALIARLAKAPLEKRDDLPNTNSWHVIAEKRPGKWAGPADPLSEPFLFRHSGKEFSFQGWALSLPPPGGDLHDAAHECRAGLLDPSIRIAAEVLPFLSDTLIGGRAPVSKWGSLADADFQAAPGLYLLNSALPVMNPRCLIRTDTLVALGRRVARLTSADASAGTSSLAPDSVQSSDGFGFTSLFDRHGSERLPLAMPRFSNLGEFDVVVAGGGTGGAPASISAARAGARTLVIEMHAGLGGVGTQGLIASYWFGNRTGFTQELDEELRAIDSQRTKLSQWNPELKSALYHRMLRDAGGRAWMNSFVFGVRKEGDRVSGLLVSTPIGAGYVEAGAIVDSTGSADIPAAAGAPCRWIDKHHVAVQGAGLSPRVPSVDCFNADHTFTDDTDPEDVTNAFVRARAKFSNDFDTASFVNSRERRQIIGDIELSPLDFLAKRTFPDTVVTASSNFDTHGFTVHPVFMIVAPDEEPLFAHVPFRCMLAKGLESVLVTGLGMSAHRDALPVIRMQADVQNQGYAAGLAAAMAAHGDHRYRNLDIRTLQQALVEKQILKPDVLRDVDSFPLPDAVLDAAVAEGPSNFFNAAVLCANPEASRKRLRESLSTGNEPSKRVSAALVLGMMGDNVAAPILIEAVRARQWDDGWNYRGMGQFGESLSPLDALVVALGRTRAPESVPVIEEKILALNETSAFSHCRAVALACICLRDRSLAGALSKLLDRPGVQGNAKGDILDIARGANADLNETADRNVCLREIYLARALYYCGDPQGRGRAILEAYRQDLRAVFARHAEAVLRAGVEELDALEIA